MPLHRQDKVVLRYAFERLDNVVLRAPRYNLQAVSDEVSSSLMVAGICWDRDGRLGRGVLPHDLGKP